MCNAVHQFEHSGDVVACFELVRLVLVLERVQLIYHDAKLVLNVLLHLLHLLLKDLLNELLDSCRNVDALVLQLQVCESVSEFFALFLQLKRLHVGLLKCVK